jgi:hypothetical protein
MANPIKLSSGYPLPVDRDSGRTIFGNSGVRTKLLLLLLCRPRGIAEPDELASPWEDPLAVRQGIKCKDDYINEIGAGIDLVPDPILEIVLDEMLRSERHIKPSLGELQGACRAAMQIERETQRALS